MNSCKNLVILSSLFACLTALADQSPIEANCYHTGGVSISRGAISSYSAASSDQAFAAQNGIIQLQPEVRTEYSCCRDLDYTVWTNRQSINLGHGYSLLVSLSYQSKKHMGDFLFDEPTLRAAAELFYRNRPVSSASIAARSLESEQGGERTLRVEMNLDNTPLRAALGASNTPEADLIELLRSRNDRGASFFGRFGDGAGLVSAGIVNCSVQIP